MDGQTGQRGVVLKEARAYRDQLLGDLDAINRFIEQLEGDETPTEPAQTGQISAYRGLGPQRAVERFLDEHRGKRYRASEIARELLRLGFETKSKNLPTIVAAALVRAVKRGIAERSKLNNRPVYRFAGKSDAGA